MKRETINRANEILEKIKRHKEAICSLERYLQNDRTKPYTTGSIALYADEVEKIIEIKKSKICRLEKELEELRDRQENGEGENVADIKSDQDTLARRESESMNAREALEEVERLKEERAEAYILYLSVGSPCGSEMRKLINALDKYFGITKESFLNIVGEYDREIERLNKAIDNTKINIDYDGISRHMAEINVNKKRNGYPLPIAACAI